MRLTLTICVIFLLALCVVWVILSRVFASPDRALRAFYGYGGESMPVAEDMLMDPLILAGPRVVPLVIEAVRKKDMPKRRYAIGFLGNGRYEQALPVLEAILQDETERDFFRGDALRAIALIDREIGLALAETCNQRSDHLGVCARGVLKNEYWIFERRTYADALYGRHY